MNKDKKNSLIYLALKKHLPRDTIQEMIKFYNRLRYHSLCKFLTMPELRNVRIWKYHGYPVNIKSYPLSKYTIEYQNTYDPVVFDTISDLSTRFSALYSIPCEIYLLQNLVFLNMSFCKLKTIPYEISFLQKLSELDMQGNLLTDLPGDLSNMAELKILGLGYNEFPKIPIVLTKMKLSQLCLTGNNLLKLPVFLGDELKLQSNGYYCID